MSSRSDRRRSGLARFWAALALAFAGLTAATLALPHDPYIRYQSLNDTIYDKAAWIYERIHFDPTPVDVVFIGSSRTNRMHPPSIEAALRRQGVAAHVVNLSLPSSGQDIRETLLKEVFAEKSPKLIVFGVVEALPRDGHEAWRELAPVGEVLTAPMIVNRNLPGALLRLPVRQITLAIATLVPEAWGYRDTHDPAIYADATIYERKPDDPAFLASPTHAETLAQQAVRRNRNLRPPLLPPNLAWVEFGVSRSEIARVVALANTNGAEIAFLYLPYYTGPDAPRETDWLEAFGPVWSAAFMKDDPRNYSDSGHTATTPDVREMMSGWLAERIATLLTDKGND